MKSQLALIVAILAYSMTAWPQAATNGTGSPASAPTSSPTMGSPVMPAPAASVPPPVTGTFFYYCQRANAYYPTVRRCDEGWIAVPAGTSAPVYVPMIEPPSFANEETVRSQPNSIDLEILGRALFYSLDYERALTRHIAVGVGFSSWQTNDWWRGYQATVSVVPVYANYYFTERPGRGFISVGVDWISVTEAGYNNDTFANNGYAAVIGGGYEIRNDSGFLLRLGGFIIAGRTTTVSPAMSFGFGF